MKEVSQNHFLTATVYPAALSQFIPEVIKLEHSEKSDNRPLIYTAQYFYERMNHYKDVQLFMTLCIETQLPKADNRFKHYKVTCSALGHIQYIKATLSAFLKFFLITIFWAMSAVPAGAVDYTIKRINNDEYYAGLMCITDKKQILWQGDLEEFYGGVNLYSNGIIRQILKISDPSTWWSEPYVGWVGYNRQGELFYQKGNTDPNNIYKYNNGNITKLTYDLDWSKYYIYNTYFPLVTFNGNDQLLFYDGHDLSGYYPVKLTLYDRGTVTSITDGSNFPCQPGMNDKGQIVWYGGPSFNESKAYLYENGTTTTIGPGYAVKINNKGVVYITMYVPYTTTYMWEPGPEGGTYTNLKISCGQEFDVNDNGQIAYSEGGNGNIFLWDKGIITQITNDGSNSQVRINNLGQIAWVHVDTIGWKYQIFVASPEGTPIDDHLSRLSPVIKLLLGD